ncbi:MAG: hypothetical protein Q4D17_02445 [Planctomycetia bacterium]|nr:hypothetical protein [Planctomycetia bacterium]
MEMTSEILREDPVPPKILAVIDIGTNSIRCLIGESFEDGRIEILEQLERALRLGRETFQRGGLSAQSMKAGIDILRRFQKVFIQYDVQFIRIVATASIREAANADIFIDRIKIATGLDVEIIDPSEEIHFAVTAVQDELGDELSMDGKNILLINVGGGSTLLAVLRNGAVVNSQSLNLGGVRMREVLANPDDLLENNVSILRHAIRETLTSAEAYFPFHETDYILAMGGEIGVAARQIGRKHAVGDLKDISTDEMNGFVDRCIQMDIPMLCRKFGIKFQTAEMAVPAFLTYQEIFKRTPSIHSFQVSSTSMRHGVMRVMAREVWGLENSNYQEEVLDSARSLSEKYHVDTVSASRTERLAVRIFNEMQAEHGLSVRYRLLLRVAAILQNAGRYVNNRSFHKHSFYLINNSEIFGLRHSETEMTAYVARYSYRSGPKVSHSNFMSLPRETRVAVSKLAAMLRIADALNHGTFPDPDTLRFERLGDELIIFLPPDDTFLLKTRSLQTQGRLFEDIFGIKVLFRT